MTAPPHPFIAAAWFLLIGGLLAADAKVSLRLTTGFTSFNPSYDHVTVNATLLLTYVTDIVTCRSISFTKGASSGEADR